jgi:hypothetical protein
MRTFKIVATVTALSVLLGSSAAFAAERTTNSATLVDPVAQAYVGTFVQSCTVDHGTYVGVYLGQSFQIQGKASLSVGARNGLAFSTSPRAFGEEGWVNEIGGQNQMGCLPIGTKVYLTYSLGMGESPIRLLASGTIK